MNYSIFELLWLFLVYSFSGWVLETAAAGFKQRRIVNRGFINGPFCIIYGISAVLLTVVSADLSAVWVFVGSLVISTVAEWIGGHLIEKIYHERWWDYSNIKFNLDGYICAPMSIAWGLLGVLAIKVTNPLLLGFFNFIPSFLGKLIVLIAAGILALDITASMIILSGRSKAQEKWQSADDWLSGISSSFTKKIYGHVDKRIRKAYKAVKTKAPEAEKTGVFAEGCGFYKIFWLFIISSFLGDIVETIFCRITAGVWMSRSSLVWGMFSVVWGLALAGGTALIYKYRDRSDGFVFMVGVVLGGAYEYVCSVFTEIVFGKVFWDYSEIPFNLGGRINLLYCFFWGIAAVVWLKKLYVHLSNAIEKIPVKIGKIVTFVLVIFMTANVVVSCMALARYNERGKGIPAESGWQQLMDNRFDDERMERIYPNAITVE